MKNCEKYTRHYFMPPKRSMRWCEKEYIDRAPVWCSVDLRDGNQALVVPMSLEEKLEYFGELVKIGFKEIEIGFPASNDTEYEFCRALIERGLIPDDVRIQVLTQSREHIIAKTFEALKGAKNAVVHLYNSTSVAQREQVFRKSRQEIIDLAVFGAKLMVDFASKTEGNFSFEYSPESFTGTEIDYAVEICNAVINVWKPTPQRKAIINLPVTVELSLPHIYASQIEYMSECLDYRDGIIISVHTHNDRGCAVADCELAMLAGAERVEGTLFGNGERTGNVDLVTLALNMYTHGVDPKLDFSDITKVSEMYERLTNMHIYERQPYAGELVFTAFAGSHQDAIAKGISWHGEQGGGWNVPYLPLDPSDIGRDYEHDIIRINSQSGKGGIGFLLKHEFGVDLPQKLREQVSYAIKAASDKAHKELTPEEVYAAFTYEFVNVSLPLKQLECHYVQKDGENSIGASMIYSLMGVKNMCEGEGNGRLDAVSNALKKSLNIKYNIISYSEHAMEVGSKSQAMSYVEISTADGNDGKTYWGAGLNTDIVTSSILALISAVNRSGLAKSAK